MKERVHLVFGLLSTAAVAVVVVLGLWLTGLPHTRRVERIDAQRLADLQRIHREIQRVVLDPDRERSLRRPLPETLEELARLAILDAPSLFDPQTGEPYGYRVLDERTYELGATFALPRAADHQVFWNHPAGRHAFRIDVLELERFR